MHARARLPELSASTDRLLYNVYNEDRRAAAETPYHRPGDPTLGDATRVSRAKHSAVLLANHGPVVSGNTLEAAVHATEELEETAKLFLLLRGLPTSPLTAEQIEELGTVFKLDF